MGQTSLPTGLDFPTHVGNRQRELCLPWLCFLAVIGKINITEDLLGLRHRAGSGDPQESGAGGRLWSASIWSGAIKVCAKCCGSTREGVTHAPCSELPTVGSWEQSAGSIEHSQVNNSARWTHPSWLSLLGSDLSLSLQTHPSVVYYCHWEALQSEDSFISLFFSFQISESTCDFNSFNSFSMTWWCWEKYNLQTKANLKWCKLMVNLQGLCLLKASHWRSSPALLPVRLFPVGFIVW